MNDPTSNGLFLGELFCYLEKIDLLNIIQYPTSILECKENLSKVLSLIKQRRRDFPQTLLGLKQIENIMKRDKHTLYSILHCLKQMYPDVHPIKNNLISTFKKDEEA